MPPPDKIYLQWHGDADPADYPNGPEPDSGDVTWCEDKIYEHDIEYVLASELAACREDADRYQVLRRNPAMLLHLSNTEFDAAIDKIRKRSAARKGEGE